MEPASAASAIGGVANPKNKRFSLRTLYSPSPRPESIVASNRKTREGFATPGSSRYHESSSTVSTRSSSRGYSRRSSGSVLTKDTAATQSSDSGEDDVTDLLKGYISDGRIRLDAGEYKTAEDDFRKALSKMEAPRSRFSVDSTPSEIRLLLSEACLGQKKFDEATKFATAVVDRIPDRHDETRLAAAHQLGIIYMQQDQLDRAEKNAMAAVRGRQKQLGRTHPLYCQSLELLNSIHKKKGDGIEADARQVLSPATTGSGRSSFLVRKAKRLLAPSSTRVDLRHKPLSVPQQAFTKIYWQIHETCTAGDYERAVALTGELLDLYRKGENPDLIDLNTSHCVKVRSMPLLFRSGMIEAIRDGGSSGMTSTASTKCSPIHFFAALPGDHCDEVQYLLDHRVGVTTTVTVTGRCSGSEDYIRDFRPIDLAAIQGNFKVFKLLYPHTPIPEDQADPNVPWRFAHTRPGNLRFIQFLVQSGVDVTTGRSTSRATMLHETAAWGDVDMVNLLLSVGARINARDSNGNTPLLIALWTCYTLCRMGKLNQARERVEVVETIVKGGADLNAVSKNNNGIKFWVLQIGKLNHDLAESLRSVIGLPESQPSSTGLLASTESYGRDRSRRNTYRFSRLLSHPSQPRSAGGHVSTGNRGSSDA